MSKDARNEDLELTPEEGEQFDALVVLLAGHGFGETGPPRDTTFARIEQFGHQAGRMLGRAVDAYLAAQHALHFAGKEPCPACDEKHPPKERPHPLPLQTPDGEVTLHEPTCRCSTCRRDFFPSADPVAD
ncbi:MAG: hypothetical protein V3R17_05335 [Hyphomicrobium sp.]